MDAVRAANHLSAVRPKVGRRHGGGNRRLILRAALRRLKTSEIAFDRRDAIAAVQKDMEEDKYVEK